MFVRNRDGSRQGVKAVSRAITPSPLRKQFSEKEYMKQLYASDIYLIFKIFDKKYLHFKAVSCQENLAELVWCGYIHMYARRDASW